MISVNVILGNAYVDDDDRDRARAAALAVLEAQGFTATGAFSAFVAEWAYLETQEAIDEGRCQTYDDMLIPASLAWIEAERAANLALTEGWANPDGAACSIGA
jgi:hypothetical protein